MSARERRAAAVALILLAGSAVAAAQLGGDTGKPPRRAAYSPKLPVAPGHVIVQRSCLMCHSAMLITQQHKDSAGWEKTVKTMENWGAPVGPAQRDSLLVYLRGHFKPEKK